MTEERRYQDDEVEAIFAAAAEGPAPAAEREIAPRAGLTLSDLRAIGAEVGIPAERIDAAARALERRPAAVAKRSYLGMPVSVGRVVDLPRALTDREWAVLLGELRQTFRAKGRAESHGELREWTNGNLHAYVEPTDTGYRLRLGTTKGTALPMLAAAAAATGYGGVMAVALLLTGQVPEAFVAPSLLMGFGGTALGASLFRQSSWARQREQQMDYIVARTQALLAAGPPGPGQR